MEPNPLRGASLPLTGTDSRFEMPPPLTGGIGTLEASPPSRVVGDQTYWRPKLTPRGPRCNGNTVRGSITVGAPSSPVRPPKRTSGSNTESPSKKTKVAKQNPTEHEDQESSGESPSLANTSIPPRSTVGAPNNPRDGAQSAPGVPALPSPRPTPPQQAEGEPQPSEQPRGCQGRSNFRECTRCNSLFDLRLTLGIRIPNMLQSTLNERISLFCGRCFMRLYMCEAIFMKDNLHARYGGDVERLQLPGEAMESRQLFYQSLAAVGRDIIKAAGHTKTRELFEQEGQLHVWSRIIGNLERTISGRPTDDADVHQSGETWKSEMDKWIDMAAAMLVHHFFGLQEWKCGGFCNFCKLEWRERNASMAVQQAIQRGDEELPEQPVSFGRLFTLRPLNPDGTHTRHPFMSNMDGRGYKEDRAFLWFAMHTRTSQVNFDDWVVEYDRWKGYEQTLQDNIDMLNALDDGP